MAATINLQLRSLDAASSILLNERKEKIMEIIKDTYNKSTQCFNCGSTFLYNEKDIEPVYPSTEYKKTYTNMIKSRKDVDYVNCYKGKAMHCPLCGAIILVEEVKFFGRKG